MTDNLLSILCRMADKMVNINLHHGGIFKKTTYYGGKRFIVNKVDSAELSFTVVMEYVKEYLKLSEIGGVYTKAVGGWKLLSRDKELFDIINGLGNQDDVDLYVDTVVDPEVEPADHMQPHVIIRPRKNIIQGINAIYNSAF